MMGFLCTNDLLLRQKMVNFKFGFLRVAVEIGDFGCSLTETKIRKKKCKIEPLEVSGHWFRVLR